VPGNSEDASLLLSLLLKASPGQSKVDFYFFFFGGSGALGIVRCYSMYDLPDHHHYHHHRIMIMIMMMMNHFTLPSPPLYILHND
jgi:hypothetical protein